MEKVVEDIARMCIAFQSVVADLNDTGTIGLPIAVVFGGADAEEDRWLSNQRVSGISIERGLLTVGNLNFPIQLSAAPGTNDCVRLSFPFRRRRVEVTFPTDAVMLFNIIKDVPCGVMLSLLPRTGEAGHWIQFAGLETTISLNSCTVPTLASAINILPRIGSGILDRIVDGIGRDWWQEVTEGANGSR